MFVAVANGVARRRIGSGAFTRVHAHDRVGHARFDCHDGVLDHRNRGRATKSQVGSVGRAHARHIRHAHGVTTVRVVERLVGDEAVDLRGFDPGIVEASLDAFEMKRMRARLRSLPDFSFTDADNGVPAGNMSHGFFRTDDSQLMDREALLIDPSAPSLHTPAGQDFQLIYVE